MKRDFGPGCLGLCQRSLQLQQVPARPLPILSVPQQLSPGALRTGGPHPEQAVRLHGLRLGWVPADGAQHQWRCDSILWALREILELDP